jgi:protein ImuB
VALVGSANLGAPALADSHRPDAVVIEPFALSAGETRSTRPEQRTRDGRVVPPWRDPTSPPAGEASVEQPGGLPLMARRLALRRIRPPRPAEVDTCAGRPVAVSAGNVAGHVIACAGPWRTSGEWWREESWARDEWDVALSDRTLCRLVRDHRTRAWSLDGLYD